MVRFLNYYLVITERIRLSDFALRTAIRYSDKLHVVWGLPILDKIKPTYQLIT